MAGLSQENAFPSLSYFNALKPWAVDGEGRERASKLGIAYSKMRGPRAVDGIRRLLQIPRMKLKHPVYESIKGAADAKRCILYSILSAMDEHPDRRLPARMMFVMSKRGFIKMTTTNEGPTTMKDEK